MKIQRIFFYLCSIPLFFSSTLAFTKVYDCFPFFNELDLLKIRLEELNDTVDYFVLVESIETQRGSPKPLYFKENRHLFEEYSSKIIHIVVEENHPEMTLWERENYQRNCILRGLEKCKPFDIVLISDLDEIPRASLVKELQPLLFKGFLSATWQKCKNMAISSWTKEKKRKKHDYKSPSFAIQMPIYFYQLNRIPTTGELWDGAPWIGTIATYYRNITKKSPQYFRDHRFELERIAQGGWHFTWMGGKDKIRQKMASVVEGREDGLTISDAEIEQWVNGFPAIPVDNSFPLYIQNNKSYFEKIGFIAECN